jgi:hypothetical protein
LSAARFSSHRQWHSNCFDFWPNPLLRTVRTTHPSHS